MNIPIITTLSEAVIDKDSCIVEAVILRAGLSENGTYYPSQVIEKAATVFKGVQCFADHPGPDEVERSVRDVVGAIEETWADENGVRARIRLSRAHDWLLTMISEGLLGDVSINAVGKTRVARRDGRVVREVVEITKAHSVDFVAKAAAGGKVDRIIRESEAYQEGLKLIERISLDELSEARPDLVEKLRRSLIAEVAETGGAEIAKLEEEIDRRRVALRRETIAVRLLDSSRLPEKIREFLLMEALALNTASEDAYEAAVQGLIERHREYLAGLSEEGLIRGMGSFRDSGSGNERVALETRELMGLGRGISDRSRLEACDTAG
jgi:hypothetical protein